jgi:hypothetical protein
MEPIPHPVEGCEECQNRYQHLLKLRRLWLDGSPAARRKHPSAFNNYLIHQQQEHGERKR